MGDDQEVEELTRPAPEVEGSEMTDEEAQRLLADMPTETTEE